MCQIINYGIDVNEKPITITYFIVVYFLFSIQNKFTALKSQPFGDLTVDHFLRNGLCSPVDMGTTVC